MKELFYDNLYLSLNISPIQKCTVLYIGNIYTTIKLGFVYDFFYNIFFIDPGLSNAMSILITLPAIYLLNPLRVEVDVGKQLFE